MKITRNNTYPELSRKIGLGAFPYMSAKERKSLGGQRKLTGSTWQCGIIFGEAIRLFSFFEGRTKYRLQRGPFQLFAGRTLML